MRWRGWARLGKGHTYIWIEGFLLDSVFQLVWFMVSYYQVHVQVIL